MTFVLDILWRVAKFTVPIPLILIAAALIWTQIDKTSAVRRAVDDALTDAVAGAQIAALEAKLAEKERQLAAGRKALDGFAALLSEAQAREAALAEQDAKDDAEYEARLKAAGRSCALTDDDNRWLRK